MSYFDEQLKQLDKDIIWDEKRKSTLENKVLYSMNSNRYKSKPKLLTGLKYAMNIGIMVVLLLFGYYFVSNSIAHQSEEGLTGNEGNQTNHNPVIKDDDMQINNPKNDENQVEIHTGTSETVIRKVEGMDQEINVINYLIQPYGIAYKFDEAFGVPEVSNNKITYLTEYDYKITVEMIEHTNLEEAISIVKERFETEGYEEIYELESIPVEENGLIGKMQFFGDNPMKGFIAYEIEEHALVITFQYPIEGADAMNPILENLRQTINVQ